MNFPKERSTVLSAEPLCPLKRCLLHQQGRQQRQQKQPSAAAAKQRGAGRGRRGAAIIHSLCHPNQPGHLGPVNTNQIPIDGGHFFTGQGALSVVYLRYMSESATPSWGKMAPSRRVGPQMSPSGVAHRLFGVTKPRSARLAWPHLRANAGHPISVNRP